MTPAVRDHPVFAAGFWRRIIVAPGPGVVVAALEDDVHRFHLRLAHHDQIVTGVEAEVERFPWSSCTQAGDFLTERLVGRSFVELADEDARSHCTHLLDLAGIAAAYAACTETVTFDLRVNDRKQQRTTAWLLIDEGVALQWQLDGLDIVGPEAWADRNLKSLSAWGRTLAPEVLRQAAMLRRAIFVSGVRSQPDGGPEFAADRGPQRLGACFSYQLPRADHASNSRQPRIDFSARGRAPLDGFAPDFATPLRRATPIQEKHHDA